MVSHSSYQLDTSSTLDESMLRLAKGSLSAFDPTPGVTYDTANRYTASAVVPKVIRQRNGRNLPTSDVSSDIHVIGEHKGTNGGKRRIPPNCPEDTYPFDEEPGKTYDTSLRNSLSTERESLDRRPLDPEIYTDIQLSGNGTSGGERKRRCTEDNYNSISGGTTSKTPDFPLFASTDSDSLRAKNGKDPLNNLLDRRKHNPLNSEASQGNPLRKANVNDYTMEKWYSMRQRIIELWVYNGLSSLEVASIMEEEGFSTRMLQYEYQKLESWVARKGLKISEIRYITAVLAHCKSEGSVFPILKLHGNEIPRSNLDDIDRQFTCNKAEVQRNLAGLIELDANVLEIELDEVDLETFENSIKSSSARDLREWSADDTCWGDDFWPARPVPCDNASLGCNSTFISRSIAERHIMEGRCEFSSAMNTIPQANPVNITAMESSNLQGGDGGYLTPCSICLDPIDDYRSHMSLKHPEFVICEDRGCKERFATTWTLQNHLTTGGCGYASRGTPDLNTDGETVCLNIPETAPEVSDIADASFLEFLKTMIWEPEEGHGVDIGETRRDVEDATFDNLGTVRRSGDETSKGDYERVSDHADFNSGRASASEGEENRARSVYAVEKILDRKVDPIDGRSKYLVQWSGLGAESSTWEPEDHLSDPSALENWQKLQAAIPQGKLFDWGDIGEESGTRSAAPSFENNVEPEEYFHSGIWGDEDAAEAGICNPLEEVAGYKLASDLCEEVTAEDKVEESFEFVLLEDCKIQEVAQEEHPRETCAIDETSLISSGECLGSTNNGPGSRPAQDNSFGHHRVDPGPHALTVQEKFDRASGAAYEKLIAAAPNQSRQYQQFIKELGVHADIVTRGVKCLSRLLRHETFSSLPDVYSFLHVAYAISQTEEITPARSTPWEFRKGLDALRKRLSDAVIIIDDDPGGGGKLDYNNGKQGAHDTADISDSEWTSDTKNLNDTGTQKENLKLPVEMTEKTLFDEIVEVMWSELNYAVAWIGKRTDWATYCERLGDRLEKLDDTIGRLHLDDGGGGPCSTRMCPSASDLMQVSCTVERDLSLYDAVPIDIDGIIEIHGPRNLQKPGHDPHFDPPTLPPERSGWLDIVIGGAFLIIIGFLQVTNSKNDVLFHHPLQRLPFSFLCQSDPLLELDKYASPITENYISMSNLCFSNLLRTEIDSSDLTTSSKPSCRRLLDTAIGLVRDGVINTVRCFENFVLGLLALCNRSISRAQNYDFAEQVLVGCHSSSHKLKSEFPSRVKQSAQVDYGAQPHYLSNRLMEIDESYADTYPARAPEPIMIEVWQVGTRPDHDGVEIDPFGHVCGSTVAPVSASEGPSPAAVQSLRSSPATRVSTCFSSYASTSPATSVPFEKSTTSANGSPNSESLRVHSPPALWLQSPHTNSASESPNSNPPTAVEDPQPLKCPYCDEIIPLVQNLNRHKRTIHPEKMGNKKPDMRYCAVKGCDYRSFRKDNVDKHMKNVHDLQVLKVKKTAAKRRRKQRLMN